MGMKYLMEKEKKTRRHPNLYADTYGSMVTLAVQQLNGNARCSTEYWTLQELQVAGPRMWTEVV